MYDSDNLEVGYVKNSIEGNKTYRTVSGQGILYIKISETDEGNKDRERKDAEFTRPIIVLVAGTRIYTNQSSRNRIMHFKILNCN